MNTETFVKKTAARIYDIAAPEKIDRGIHLGYLEEEFMKDTKALLETVPQNTGFDPKGFPFFRWDDLGAPKIGSRKLSQPWKMALADLPEDTEPAFALMELAGALVNSKKMEPLSEQQVELLHQMLNRDAFSAGAYKLLVEAVGLKKAYRAFEANQFETFVSSVWAKMDLRALRPLCRSTRYSSGVQADAVDSAAIAAFNSLDLRSKAEALILLKAGPTSTFFESTFFELLPPEMRSLTIDCSSLNEILGQFSTGFEYETLSKAESSLKRRTDEYMLAMTDVVGWMASTQLQKVVALSPDAMRSISQRIMDENPFTEGLIVGSLTHQAAWLLHKVDQEADPATPGILSTVKHLPQGLKAFFIVGPNRKYFDKAYNS